jgi:hypothetical protein
MIVGLDTGERKGKTFAVWDAEPSPAWSKTCATNMRSYDHPLDAIKDSVFVPGTRIVLESSTCNFDPHSRSEFIRIAKERGIDIYPIYAKHTKNRRKDHGLTYDDKDDRLDAWTILQIGKEGIIPRCRFTDFKLSMKPDVRLRQVGYDPYSPAMAEIVPNLAAAVDLVREAEIPECAVVMGAARQLKSTRKWNEGKYQMYTAVVRALMFDVDSWRAMKKSGRTRCLSRSNYMHHGLKNKSYAERKRIMKAQDNFDRFVFKLLAARRLTLAGSKETTASRSIRAAS